MAVPVTMRSIPCALGRCLLISIGLLITGIATADPQQYQFDLPRQPLKQALSVWSSITQQPILFSPQQLEGLNAPALQGNYTAEQAVAKLLGETTFYAVHGGSNGWLIKQSSPIETPPAEPARPFIDEVLVVGRYSRSLDSAVAAKRDAAHRQDAIFAEDIGEFPALNIAEAINRSPGVSVIRDRGEALFISIRGLPSQFNRFTLNGQPVATNENMRTSEQYGRRFHYDTLPAELVSQVAVNKSASATDQEGGIGGQVDVRTFRPLDVGTSATLNLAASHSDLATETSPRAAALGSWTNAEHTLGVLLAGTYSERQLRQDRALNFRWYQVSDDSMPMGAPDGAISPGSVRPTLELEERALHGFNAAMQWQPTPATEAQFNVLSLRQAVDYQEFSYSADYDPATLTPGSLEWRRNALIGGSTAQGSVQIGYESAGFTHLLQAADATFEHQLNAWRVVADLAASVAESDNSAPIRRTRLRRERDVDFTFHYPRAGSDSVPSVHYDEFSLLDSAALPGRRLEFRVMNSDSEFASAGIAFRRGFGRSAIEHLEFGIKTNRNAHHYRRRDAVVTEQIAGQYFPADFFAELPVDDFLGRAHGGLPRSWLVPLEQQFWRSADTASLLEAAPSQQDQLNSYAIDETTNAGYLQANVNYKRLRGNVGVRRVATRQRSSGFQPHPSGAGGPLQVTVEQDYSQWLPALNVVYEMQPDLLWRLGAAKVINRPELQDLAPRLTLNSGDAHDGTAGNPKLKPVTAWQYESALEWYFDKNNLLSAGFFHIDLDGFVQPHTQTQLIGTDLYQVTSPTNGASAQVSGLELNYQQIFDLANGSRWGLQGNTTWTDSHALYRNDHRLVRDRLADVADSTANMSLFWETDRWDARVNYSWRGHILKHVGSHTLAAQNSAAFGTWDAHASVRVSHGWQLSLEGINITGEAEQEFVYADEFGGYSYYGRTYIIGLKYSL